MLRLSSACSNSDPGGFNVNIYTDWWVCVTRPIMLYYNFPDPTETETS